MDSMLRDVLETILARTSEAVDLDFKASFDPANAGEWLELIKDVVAMANSGGGAIVVGVADDGNPSHADVSRVISIDPADLTNKIYKYTGINFHGFEMAGCLAGEAQVCVIKVDTAAVPIVFTKVGTYESVPGKQKNAFSGGAVYFRHGAKSEPATSDDLRQFVERSVESIRRSWLEGIAKVVEAPAGARIVVEPPAAEMPQPNRDAPLRLVDDPTAPAYFAVPIDTTHPYRAKEVVREVNRRLAGRKSISMHHVLCVRRAYALEKDVTYCYLQKFASPRYSQAFVEWLMAKYEEDALFFETAKMEYDSMARAGA
jgi:hypothetical protein